MKSKLTEFLYEIGQLKRVQRCGWWLAGIDQAESVAEHSFRTAVIAYALAALEGADAEKAAAMALLHDSAETRVNDLHRVGKNYIDWPAVGKRVVDDQLQELPPQLRDRLSRLHEETRAQSSPEAQLVEDADRLECLLQAREYAARGHDVTEWIQSSMDSPSLRDRQRPREARTRGVALQLERSIRNTRARGRSVMRDASRSPTHHI